MRRISRLTLTLSVLCSLALGVSTSTASARGNVLPDATYEILVQLNEDLLAFDEDPGQGTMSEMAADFRAICETYPTDDPLLAHLRKQCNAAAKSLDLMSRECTTKRSCRRLLTKLDATGEQSYRLAVAANRVVDQHVPAGACRTALRSARTELRAIRQQSRLQTAFMRALLDENEQSLKALEKRLKRFAKLKVRTPEQVHKAIVAHC
ncbi:MAG: hypothetical protein WC558_12985 [Patulibacter sp.]